MGIIFLDRRDASEFKSGCRSDFPDGAVIKNLPANAGDKGSIPSPGKIPHAVEQLSPCTTTTELVCHSY